MPKKVRPKGYRHTARLNRERGRQGQVDSPKASTPYTRQTAQVPHPQVQPYLFKPVDLSWQVNTVTQINQKYDAELNIVSNLQQTQESHIDVPTKCEKIVGDGNCFFRCISFLLFGNENYHVHIRQVLLLHMCTYAALFHSLLPPNTGMAEYIAKSRMSEDKVWATQVEIMSMAHLLKTDIYTYSRYGTKLKWLKHSATLTDTTLQVCDKHIYLDHSTGHHFNVVLSVGPIKSIEQGTNENSLLWNEILRQNSRREYFRNYYQNLRKDPDFKQKESEKRKENLTVLPEKRKIIRDKTRKALRADGGYTKLEAKKRNNTRKALRADGGYKKLETQKRNNTRKALRADSDYTNFENQKRNNTRKALRADSDYTNFENQKRNNTRKALRADSDYTKLEAQKRNKTRKALRADSDYTKLEAQKRNKTRKALRADSDCVEQESKNRNRTRRALRTDNDYRKRENKKRNKTRIVLRREKNKPDL